MLRGKWWEIFQEPELNALEEQVNINNQNIRQSFETFMSARARSRRPDRSTGLPSRQIHHGVG